MGQESKKGSDFYKAQGLRALTIHVPKLQYRKLAKLAERDERSVQVTARRILLAHLAKVKL